MIGRQYLALAAAGAALALLTAGCRRKEVTGQWDGKLDLSSLAAQLPSRPGTPKTPASLRLEFKFSKGSDGKLSGTMDSPDQNAAGIVLDKVELQDDRLHLEAPMVGAKFDGTLNGEGNEVKGTFTQGPLSFPLELRKGP